MVSINPLCVHFYPASVYLDSVLMIGFIVVANLGNSFGAGFI